MATKRRTNNSVEDRSPDLLVRPKVRFRQELAERIEKGEELLARNVTNSQELASLYEAYLFWHDYNKELLQRAFNKVDNAYYKEYTYEPSFFVTSMYERTPTFAESVSARKADVNKHLTRLKKINEKLNLIDEAPGIIADELLVDKNAEALQFLSKTFGRFHRVAQSLRHRHDSRDTLIIRDEYDVQDLLRSILQIQFDDLREEDYSPSYAGASTRIDFVLKKEKIVVETKMTNDRLKDKEIGNQLSVDIARYRAHPDCQTLVVFIYDKEDHIRNKMGLINDLQKLGTPQLTILVYINPL